jgi:hypothetical protein
MEIRKKELLKDRKKDKTSKRLEDGKRDCETERYRKRKRNTLLDREDQ